MGQNSKIEWTDHTFNPWVGCTKLSPACDHCYAEGWARRTGQAVLWQGERRRTSEANWRQPLKWDREAAAAGVRRKVFCASLADVFDNQVPVEWRTDLWRLIRETPSLDWLLLTKRPQNIAKMVDSFPPNVWLGTTVENQEEADKRIPHLLDTPAAVRFLSCEPLLGPVNLRHLVDTAGGNAWIDCLRGETACPGWGGGIGDRPQATDTRIDWVIAGGESGPGARPAHPDWFRSLRDQCAAAGVAFHFKQHGEWIGVPDLRRLPDGQGPGFGAYDHWPYDEDREAVRVGKKRAGRLLDGVEHDAFPQARP